MPEDRNTLVSRLQFILKVVELSLSIVCMGLIVDPMNHKLQLNVHHIGLVYVAYAGFIFINTVVIIGQTRAERMPQFMVGTTAISKCWIMEWLHLNYPYAGYVAFDMSDYL
jgi:hypothetical protein